MRITEYARLRRRGVWGAWRATKWDEIDWLLARAAIVALIFVLVWEGLGYYERQEQRMAHLGGLIELQQETIAAREIAIVTLLNGGTIKADTDVVTCRIRDAASVRVWR